MGTRHIFEVKSKGKLKIAQYGQWDGYPTGQGETIAQTLREYPTKVIREAVDKLEPADKNKEYMIEDHPQMSRDVGAEILKTVIENPDIKEVWLEESDWNGKYSCYQEYVYTIDLDNETVVVNDSRPYSFEEWKTEGMMKSIEVSESIRYNLLDLGFEPVENEIDTYENSEFILRLERKKHEDRLI